MSRIDTRKLLQAIHAGTLNDSEKEEAMKHLDEEIFQCDEVLQDQETEPHVRREYRAYKTEYNKALTKLKQS